MAPSIPRATASRAALNPAVLKKAALLFGIWTTYGLLSAWQSHYWYSFGMHPLSWPDAVRYELTYAWLWGLCCPLILWLSNRFRIERDFRVRHLLVHLAAMIVMVAFTKTAYEWLSGNPESTFLHFTWQKLIRSIVMSSDTGALLYCTTVLVEHSLIYYTRYRTGLINAGRLQTELARSQLQALKMQLHPHFLFNTLHTISALVQEDPERAERTIARLSELLRLFLATSTIHEVTLGEEMRILDLYLEIERTRFEDRLSVHYDVPAELLVAMVPNLVLQPLVENAIRHGIGRRSGAGWIAITAERYGETLVVRVTDNGEGLKEDPDRRPGSGKGLSITRGRLESLYGSNHSLGIRNLPAGGVEARITLPFRTESEVPHGSSEERENAELQGTNS
jgi:two-component system, LytTR family, sensor kinase